MKTAQPLGITSILASATLPRFRFIGFNGGLCAANAKALGVSDSDADSGQQAGVMFSGIGLVEAAASIAQGASLVSDAAGKAITATVFSATVPAGGTAVTSTSAGPAMTLAGSVLPQSINGYALDTGVAGDIIRVMVI
ncbi:capsid cement protein [Iodobacter arcticus]|uniref:Capsid cement protein n=1 Tax=Iodobacter arcticus TaxID=590593 RepID=A0ABW2QV73_9NEIS